MMRASGPVVHLAAGHLYGGVETFLVVLARAPKRLEHRFVLFFEGRLGAELRAAGAQVEVLGPVRLSRPWTMLKAQARLGRLLSRWRPRLVVCHSPWLRVAAGWALRGVRVGHFLHGPLDFRSPVDRLSCWLPPHLLLANSTFTADSARTMLPGLKPVVTGCPVEERAPGPGGRLAVRRGMGVPDALPVIIQVSRMEAWKGHALLLEALARLPASTPWECWLVGGAQRPSEAAYLSWLKARAGALGLGARVRFLGERSDVPELLCAADIFCQPNLTPEPFGIAYVEAMYAGLPVLGTDMGGPREIVEPACGALVPPRPERLAEVLAEWLKRPVLRAELGRAGQRRARESYAPALRVELLEAALAGGPEHGLPTAPPVRMQ